MTGYVEDMDLSIMATLMSYNRDGMRRIDHFRYHYQFTYWIDLGRFVEVRVRKTSFFTGRSINLGSRFVLLDGDVETAEQAEAIGEQYAKRIIQDHKKRAFWRRSK